MDAGLALAKIYEASRLPISFPAFLKFSRDWEVIPLYKDGKIAGGVMVRDAEIHCCAFNRTAIRILGDVIAKNGFAWTRVQHGNEESREFVKRLGFVETGKDESVTYYEVKTCPLLQRLSRA